MAGINQDIPIFECMVDRRYLTDGKEGGMEGATVFGISSVMNQALGFHVMMTNGAVVFRLPIIALRSRPVYDGRLVDDLQLWDCLSYECSVHTFRHLEAKRCKAHLKSGKSEFAKYMFTIDWQGSMYADRAGELGHKCAHFLELDSGYFAALPNNRIWPWFDPAGGDPGENPPKYQTNQTIWRVEGMGRWRTTEEHFYEIHKEVDSGKDIAQELKENNKHKSTDGFPEEDYPLYCPPPKCKNPTDHWDSGIG